MSSREIAELTGKEHFHVIRDIERMLAHLGEAASKFGGRFRAADNTMRRCFNLSKRETLPLVSGYSVELRARISTAGRNSRPSRPLPSRLST